MQLRVLYEKVQRSIVTRTGSNRLLELEGRWKSFIFERVDSVSFTRPTSKEMAKFCFLW